jgi:hypothetical protein
MNYRKINNLTGWITGGIALIVYLMTMERTVSFWDCGEFLSCAYKLEVGHSPGAPFFMIIQRMFALFSGGAAMTGGPSTSAALFMNAESAVASALTILFLTWTITHFAKRLIAPGVDEPTKGQLISIMGAGVVGGLAYTFSDSFWFSAVEAEVYATSSFLTALTFWAMLKWEHVANNKYADRWLVFISFLIGISVCVHLLSLLVIPTLAMVYYFKRYEATYLGTFIAFIVGCVVLAFVQFGIIQYIPRFASKFDLIFTNDFGMPFDTGAIVFLMLLVGLLVFLLMLAKKKNLYTMHTGVLCVIFIIIGYSAYLAAVVRSRADVPIDMTNPDNPSSFLDYVNREQFGQQPLLFGPYFTSDYTDVKQKGFIYAQTKENGKDKYIEVGKKVDPVYGVDPQTGENQSHFFPRIWDANDQNHVNFYRSYLGLGPNDQPTGKDNLDFFLGYQMNWMYWRFFMWNFAGRQNDFEGQTDPYKGNWISGIGFIDKMRGLGDTDAMGHGYSDNDAHNKLYFLPFILGILGLVFQFNRNRKDGFIVLTLFFFTGAAIGIYLNMPPLQPRERDYAFAGSTYTFAIWIGLGVLMVHQWFKKLTDTPAAAIGAVVLCLVAVPMLMANVEWKDHDRSNKTLARSVAYNTLSCCAPNAVLFTFGDNQTYPLWYAQEVEGFRRDVRIINTSLLGIGWYIEQLNYKANDAAPVPMMWKKESYQGDRRNYIGYYDNPALKIPKDRYFSLADICDFMNSEDNRNKAGNGREMMNYMPTRNFFAPSLSKEEIVSRGLARAEDTARIMNEMKFSFPKSTALKSDLAILNIIAAVAKEGWKRPLYFDAGLRQGDYGGTGEYMHMEGMVYRLMPFKYQDSMKVNSQVLGTINTAKSYDLFMNKFTWGGAERNDVYFDEPNRHEFVSYRMDASFLANQLAVEGKKEEAVKVLDKVMAGITEHSYNYDYTGYFIASAYYRAGAKSKATALSEKIVRNCEELVNYAASLPDERRAQMASEVQQQFQIMQSLAQTAYSVGDTAYANKIANKMQAIGPKVKDLLNVQGGGEGAEE